MSTFAYGAITAQREDAPPAERVTAPNASPLRSIVDAAAALVPAEVLAVHVLAMPQLSETREIAGVTAFTITDKGAAQLLFWILVVTAMAVYALGHRRRRWDRWDFVRMLIPAGAFVCWSALQPTSAFDAVADPSPGMQYVIGVAGVVVLGLVAGALSTKADAKVPERPH
jgi:hypothetical protein